MRIKNYLGIVIWVIVLWAIGVLAVYGIIYVTWGVKFWQPMH
jgi:hypothetical protein